MYTFLLLLLLYMILLFGHFGKIGTLMAIKYGADIIL